MATSTITPEQAAREMFRLTCEGILLGPLAHQDALWRLMVRGLAAVSEAALRGIDEIQNAGPTTAADQLAAGNKEEHAP